MEILVLVRNDGDSKFFVDVEARGGVIVKGKRKKKESFRTIFRPIPFEKAKFEINQFISRIAFENRIDSIVALDYISSSFIDFEHEVWCTCTYGITTLGLICAKWNNSIVDRCGRLVTIEQIDELKRWVDRITETHDPAFYEVQFEMLRGEWLKNSYGLRLYTAEEYETAATEVKAMLEEDIEEIDDDELAEIEGRGLDE